MAGIYFVYADSYSQCWIGVSKYCNKRMELIKEVLHGDAQCYYIPTFNFKRAKEVMKHIKNSLKDYAVEDTRNHWYDLESLQVGIFIQQVKEYVEAYYFPPYEEEGRGVKRKYESKK